MTDGTKWIDGRLSIPQTGEVQLTAAMPKISQQFTIPSRRA